VLLRAIIADSHLCLRVRPNAIQITVNYSATSDTEEHVLYHPRRRFKRCVQPEEPRFAVQVRRRTAESVRVAAVAFGGCRRCRRNSTLHTKVQP